MERANDKQKPEHPLPRISGKWKSGNDNAAHGARPALQIFPTRQRMAQSWQILARV